MKLERPSLFHFYYAYMDTKDYRADDLFIKHQVTVKFETEFARPGSDFIIVLCRIRKKDNSRFLTAIREFPNKMLLLGYDNCIECWRALEGILKETSSRAFLAAQNASTSPQEAVR